ncbi:MAG: fumarylacetoacetate hydrolase family protein [Steroidobacteraceae bacterium]|nr:fumarylacetoacetate hydrolase family protein [Steroidobacteraceae bacterium]
MKLASLRSDGRDGQLVVVNRALTRYARVADVAPSLQSALDRWPEVEPQLREIAAALEAGTHPQTHAFDPRECMAPLPRAFHWADGSAYVNHIELVRKARGAEMPSQFWKDPLIYQGGSDDFLGACDDARFVSEEHGIDLEAEVGVITDDVPMGTPADRAAEHIKLLVLINDWTLRNLVPGELAKGFGFYQSKPATGFSPVAITPDELGAAWRGGKVHLPLVSHINGRLFGRPNAGVDMTFDFHQIIAHAAYTRRLGAGTIIGSGTVSNRDRSTGSSCLAEVRALEMIEHGAPRTPFLSFGDRVRVEMMDPSGASLFGAIDQRVVRA